MNHTTQHDLFVSLIYLLSHVLSFHVDKYLCFSVCLWHMLHSLLSDSQTTYSLPQKPMLFDNYVPIKFNDCPLFRSVNVARIPHWVYTNLKASSNAIRYIFPLKIFLILFSLLPLSSRGLYPQHSVYIQPSIYILDIFFWLHLSHRQHWLKIEIQLLFIISLGQWNWAQKYFRNKVWVWKIMR